MPQPKETLFWLPSNGARLASVLHHADSRRLVILSHGFTGHKGETGRLFVTAARALAAAGISAIRFDFMGSGDSTGEFYEMSPNTEIADLKNVVRWARRRYKMIGLLGLSCGGAVSICALSQLPPDTAKALVTWSTAASFVDWSKRRPDPKTFRDRNPMREGLRFYSDIPTVDVPEAYCGLTLPKLQIQGDHDLPGLRERFTQFFPDAPQPKRHIVLPDADHTFSKWSDRKKVIGLTVNWFTKYLKSPRVCTRSSAYNLGDVAQEY